ncbi:conserved membrane hypothetical protein [Flavobacterium sp. 9AF]|uniref:sensor histidine kinase n=1 Tax=Flavobacterium sp. 9AF TaxID=2653142 RepID=UPI0012F2FF3E|nr:histidine kinase [Flavobacterium sp. 9AF]VXB51296.1 conserved membrane hypothetical protein [Flavobacterium sp. 9AF]
MQLVKKIKEHRYFLYFIFLFGYAQSIQIRYLIRRELSGYLFTPEAAISSFISSCIFFSIILYLIKKWQKKNPFSIKNAIKTFSIAILIYLAIINLIGFAIAFLFNNIERNFNTETLTHAIVSYFMDAIIYGSFFLAYYYHLHNKKYLKQLNSYSNALSESKIKQLKTQLNPHFLFNNLNVLDQLIEEDKNKASEFLNEFAEIYRYVLRVSDKKTIPLKEEIDFIKKYFSLIEHKYNLAFQLKIEEKEIIQNQLIVPLALQILIENAIKHNIGNEKNPIKIVIKIDKEITVSNNLNIKQVPLSSGKGLENLKEQYLLLSKNKIQIIKTQDNFTVILPLISNKTNENNYY